LVDFVHGVDANRRIGVIAAPGDRRDEDLREVGRIASSLDYVIVKEDQDLRGREQGGTAQFIIDGLLDGGMEENQFETIYSEPEAIAAAMLQMKDNDLVVILADHVSESLDAVRQYSSGMK
jgi:cyanophycin synthetase